MNLNFYFQGCQKMQIRVAISWSDGGLQFTILWKIIGKWSTQNDMLVESCEHFWSPKYPWAAQCPRPSVRRKRAEGGGVASKPSARRPRPRPPEVFPPGIRNSCGRSMERRVSRPRGLAPRPVA